MTMQATEELNIHIYKNYYLDIIDIFILKYYIIRESKF
jgi:hypothetical protein